MQAREESAGARKAEGPSASAKVWLVLTLAIILNSAANILLKAAMNHASGDRHVAAMALAIVTNPVAWAAVATYVLAMSTYAYVLGRMNLSKAYPILTSLGVVVVAVASLAFLGESLILVHWAGIVAIFVGVWLVARE
jgi:multidrug transporter EmrE-like cation transporter